MFDLGWGEMAVIALVAIIILGPKELPHALKTLGRAIRKVREVSREFQGHVDEMVREAELDDVRKQLEDVKGKGITKALQEQVDPKGEFDIRLDPTESDKPKATDGKAADPKPAETKALPEKATPEPAGEALPAPAETKAEPAPVSEPVPASEPAKASRKPGRKTSQKSDAS
ncbi:MAG: Sec-independent protein translocase protein TatB [Oceanibaculum nanhaiense]|uniref:Sec-independent protein translocase protein TatB n=1 Tax=Oceanibaculum nanhaiense TaxID=1909734 RepID=UPI0025A3F296|nr:Sec-independent protein translocase protein TatB [Oceanibaculum nanhaiense]MDM7947822.1 Sec-independent protein translocase protein TatB [Oceanibaculum nanhaiense]